MKNATLSELSKLSILPRKPIIEHPKTILHGTPKSGKSYFALGLLQEEGQGHYFDLRDPRHTSQIATSSNSVSPENLLVIDHWTPSIPLPPHPRLLAITNQKPGQAPPGFQLQRFYSLNFEEYLIFEKRHQNIENSFSRYLKDGVIPELVGQPVIHKINRHIELVQLLTQDGTKRAILTEIIRHSGSPITPYQLYTRLKEGIKISKDKLYATLQHFQEQHLIHFIPHLTKAKAPQKLFFFDFGIQQTFQSEKNFVRLMEQVIFHELLTQGYQVGFTDTFHFYLPRQETAILNLPFANEELINNRLGQLKHDLPVQKIEVVTLSHAQEGVSGGVKFEAKPFWEWALEK